ncbi:hypothetical protein SNARM312S_05231 [Streptomyces narbonensis]
MYECPVTQPMSAVHRDVGLRLQVEDRVVRVRGLGEVDRRRCAGCPWRSRGAGVWMKSGCGASKASGVCSADWQAAGLPSRSSRLIRVRAGRCGGDGDGRRRCRGRRLPGWPAEGDTAVVTAYTRPRGAAGDRADVGGTRGRRRPTTMTSAASAASGSRSSAGTAAGPPARSTAPWTPWWTSGSVGRRPPETSSDGAERDSRDRQSAGRPGDDVGRAVAGELTVEVRARDVPRCGPRGRRPACRRRRRRAATARSGPA